MDMCNLLKRMLPLSQPSNDVKGTYIARQNLLTKEDQNDLVRIISEISKAHNERKNLILTSNGGTDLTGVNSVDGVVIIPEGVTHIQKKAFSFSEEIEAIIIPSSVSTIDDGAFSCLSKIETIQVHKDNKSFIVINGILYDKGLTRVIKATRHCIMKDIPTDIKQIDSWAYAYCSSAVEINIPYGVTEIGQSAFRECMNLKRVNFTNRMSTIRKDMFMYCRDLIKVVLPRDLRVIESNAFSDCVRFREMDLPDCLESIERFAFEGFKNLERVNLGSMVRFISPEAFS